MYKPKRPKEVKALIKGYTNGLLPHFFKYAKDKNDGQVVCANSSFVNKLDGKIDEKDVIPNHYINLRHIGLGDIDYRLLMHNPDIECGVAFDDNGRIIEEKTDPLIVAYCDLNRQHRFVLDNAMRIDKTFSVDTIKKSQLKYDLKYRNAVSEIKDELSKYGYDDEEIADVLVKFLYGVKNSKHKTALWFCYGDIVFSNLEKKLESQTKEIQCADCGEWFNVSIFDSATCRCDECVKEHRRELARLRKKKQRENNKCHATL